MLNVLLMNVVSIRSINYINTHVYTYVYPKINIHPRCHILEAHHELTPESAS